MDFKMRKDDGHSFAFTIRKPLMFYANSLMDTLLNNESEYIRSTRIRTQRH